MGRLRTSEYRARVAAGLSEETLEKNVRDLCKALGVVRVHHRVSIGTKAGWPDDVLIGKRVLYRELKTETGRVSKEQADMMNALRAAGADVAVWRPLDWYSGEIEKQIREITR